MSMYLSDDISWAMSALGKIASRAEGLIGSFVPGSSGGASGSGRSGSMLYHFFGISSGVNVVLMGLTVALLVSPPEDAYTIYRLRALMYGNVPTGVI